MHDEAGAKSNKRTEPQGAQTEKDQENQATRIVNFAQRMVDLFTDSTGEPFASFTVNDHRETHALRTRGFKNYLAQKYYKDNGKIPATSTLNDALNTLAGIAQYEGGKQKVHLRVAHHEGAVYVDIGNDAWQQICVTSEGWSIIESADSAVRFRRSSKMLPLPMPEKGGSLDTLRDFVNIRDDEKMTLLKSWVLSAFMDGPHTVLALSGEQGSAKSTAMRVLRSLIDPAADPIRRPPRDERDIWVGANANFLVMYDNLSNLSPDLSDALCVLATGGSYGRRALYTDLDEMVVNARRPIAINSIGEVATRGDLRDRSIIMPLDPISDSERRNEREFWDRFEKALPKLFGAVLDAIAVALQRLPEVQQKTRTTARMADYVLWSLAAAPAAGYTEEAFIKAYDNNRTSAHELVVEDSLVAQAIKRLIKSDEFQTDGFFQGSATELLKRLSEIAGEPVVKNRAWPKRPTALAMELGRIAPSMRKSAQINIQMLQRTEKSRGWRIEPVEPSPPRSRVESASGASGASFELDFSNGPAVTPDAKADTGMTHSPHARNGASSKNVREADLHDAPDGDDASGALPLQARLASESSEAPRDTHPLTECARVSRDEMLADLGGIFDEHGDVAE